MNSKIKLKVCGMRDPENILQVAELHPDYMGFIFYSKSKRHVGDNFKIPPQLDKIIKRVGVFVNESTEKIVELALVHNLDFIQLHGNEQMSQCVELKQKKLGVIKVFSMEEGFDFLNVAPYKKVVDYFLFDTKSDRYGGTGKTFDWNLLGRYDQEIPFFLSGGLSAVNIQRAKNLVYRNLHALDVNSGVEILPGLKSIDKLKVLNAILTS
jgi:phosphoribosylanthranilate isomerase